MGERRWESGAVDVETVGGGCADVLGQTRLGESLSQRPRRPPGGSGDRRRGDRKGAISAVSVVSSARPSGVILRIDAR